MYPLEVFRLGESAMRDAIGANYETSGVLGSGSMGEVRSATVRSSGQKVAIKVLRPELSGDRELVRRFLQERELLTSISHPNLVGVRDMVAEGTTLAIVMDLVVGPDLRRYLAERTTLAPGLATELIAQVLDGLSAVHAAGIVHLDIKPENILIDLTEHDRPAVRITDFGVAGLAYSKSPRGALWGTPAYMAPEIVRGKVATPAADIYACGTMLYELISGSTPFGGGSQPAASARHMRGRPTRPAEISEPLWKIMKRLLAGRPTRRIGAAQASKELRSVLPTLVGAPPAGRQTVIIRGPGKGRPNDGHVPSHRWRVLFPVGLVVLLIAGALFALVRQKPTIEGEAVTYAFGPVIGVNGVAQTSVWRLTGKAGDHFQGQDRLDYAGDQEVSGNYDVVLPKSLASSLSEVKFTPSYTQLKAKDPIVTYAFRLGPSNRSLTITYDLTVKPDGRNPDRLTHWAVDQRLAQASDLDPGGPASLTLKALSVSPKDSSLRVDDKVPLIASVTMSDDSPAPRSIVDTVAWKSADLTVAAVEGGVVRGVHRGATTVTAQIGALSSSVSVTVVDATGSAPLRPTGTTELPPPTRQAVTTAPPVPTTTTIRPAAPTTIRPATVTVVIPPLAAAAPTSVSALAEHGGAKISWGPPSSDGGAQITGYRVTPYDFDAKVFLPTKVVGVSFTSINYGGLTNGHTYTFAIAADNSAGTGAVAFTNDIVPA